MKLSFYRKHECQKAKGLCIVIDVLRAFTTAAYAFHQGAKNIILVSTKEEARAKFQKNPSLLLMGEEHGLPIEGFHFPNSPSAIHKISLQDRTLVQRTSAGTQGVTLCSQSTSMLLASFVVAEATIQHIQDLNAEEVSFIITGTKNGDEDLAFAEYASERLKGSKISPEPYLERVLCSPTGQLLLTHPNLKKDLELALKINQFSFAMEVEHKDGEHIARAIPKQTFLKKQKT